MITFLPLEHPAYPSNATLEAEECADIDAAQQQATEAAFAKLCRRFADDAEYLFNRMPLGVRIRGYDAPHILTLVRRDFTNFQEATMEEAMEAVEP